MADGSASDGGQIASGYSKEQIATMAGESRQPGELGVVITFTFLSLVFVILRLVSRFGILRKPSVEDHFIAIALVFSLTIGALTIRQIAFGDGQHAVNVPQSNILEIRKCLYLITLLHICSTVFTKLSILLQYRKLAQTAGTQLAIWISAVIVMAYGVEAFFTSLFLCMPAGSIHEILPQNKCLPWFPVWYANAGMSTATNILIAAIPLPAFYAIVMSKKQKIALGVCFVIGWLACVVSFLRIVAISQLQQHVDDLTFAGAPLNYWTVMEVNIGMVACSLPALKPLLAHIGHSVLTKTVSDRLELQEDVEVLDPLSPYPKRSYGGRATSVSFATPKWTKRQQSIVIPTL